jgi:ABC-type glycerol-3-phosphate transport system substrate-binding protein/ABC-type nitrate/sulfonate/bicarbonate transport system permease component
MAESELSSAGTGQTLDRVLESAPRRRGRTRPSAPDRVFDAVNLTILALVLVALVYPLYFVLISSISEPSLVNTGKVTWYPRGLTVQGYTRVLRDPNILIGYRNTFIYTGVGTALNVTLTVLAGYALSRRDLKGRNVISAFIVFTMLFNGGLIPLYLLVRNLGLLNSIGAMVLPTAVNVVNLIIARTFFATTIPDELLEAARVDGCGTARFFFQITASDGNIYALFKLNEGSWTTTCPLTYLNKPWLDELGAEVPTTTEEYYELLMAVKNAGDLNGNGEADEIPLSFNFGSCAQGMSTFFWAHGLPVEEGFGDNRDLMMVQDGKVVYAPTQEGFRDTAKYLHRLWEAGLIDPEVFSHDWSGYVAKFKQDQLFSFNDWWAQNSVDTTRWLDWEYLPALKAPGYEPKANYRFAWTRGIAPITAAAEHPEVVMRWIDYWYDPLNSLTTMEGPLGVRVIENDDGTYGVAPTPEGLGLSEWRDLETIGPGFITSIDIDMYLNMFIFEAAEMCGTVKYDTYADQWPEMYWPRPMMSSAQINEEQAMLPDIQALVKKTLARWITEGGADEEWDQFQADLNSIGLPRLMEIWQENLDKFLEGTGGVTPRPYDRGTGHPVRPL